MFGVKHLLLGPFGALTLLALELGDALLFGGQPAQHHSFYLVYQQLPGPVAVQGLGALLLAFDLYAAGQVFQVNAGGGLIDVLSARTG